jgi:hypothetical protein
MNERRHTHTPKIYSNFINKKNYVVHHGLVLRTPNTAMFKNLEKMLLSPIHESVAGLVQL